MTTQLNALQSALNLIADAAKDTVDSAGESGAAKLASYQNLVADVLVLIPQIGQIPAEVSSLKPEDYVSLVEGLIARMSITDAHAQLVITAGLKLLNDIVSVVIPDVSALLAAIHNTTPPAAA